MKILFAAAECAPFVKIGGLADVVGSLPKALGKLGADIAVILPYYESVSVKDKTKIKSGIEIEFDQKTVKVDLWQTTLPKSDIPLILVSNDQYFSGEPYSGEDSRFLFFSKVVAEVAPLMNFDLVHCHDWHTGLVPYLLKGKTIFTIHNIAYQGVFKSKEVNRLIGSDFKTEEVNSIRIGIENADLVTTVSPNYAKEILTAEFGFGLEDALEKRKDDLFGIINGIDLDQFSPEKDSLIPRNYSIESLELKKENKIALQEECFSRVDLDVPLIGMVTRIADQKGFDLLKEALPEMKQENLQLVVLGTGAKEYEKMLEEEARKNPLKISVGLRFDDALARRIYAGSDLFLMPSHFEPCGLGQMIAMNYGSIPIVRGVGGLKDTVKPNSTGFVFFDKSAQSLVSEIRKALTLFKDQDVWRKMQRDAMNQDFSWNNSAKEYLKLYERVLQL